jgi:hypothetical protein
MRITGERFEIGHLVEAVPGGWRVRLEDGRELVAQVGHARGLYRFEAGERVYVSLAPDREPVLTGYLT